MLVNQSHFCYEKNQSYKNEFYEDDLAFLSVKNTNRDLESFFLFDSRCLNRLEGVLGLK
jgi:hypothetical protein